MILRNANKMVELMGGSSYDFIMSHNDKQLSRWDGFVHRTFNDIDFKYFVISLQNIYMNHQGMENVFSSNVSVNSVLLAITEFKNFFLTRTPI